jgi:uncharacterized membrane protein
MASVDNQVERDKQESWAVRLNRAVYRAAHHWFAWFVLISGLWVGIPWLAPIFMHLGWTGPAEAIYFVYSFQCHQLPERSFFMFGPKAMYGLGTIQSAWKDTLNPLVLRQFIGNAQLGWKVGWSDRMVSAYSSIPLAALAWWPFRDRVKPLPAWGFLLFVLPMAIDGTSHFFSDLAGIGQGFRYTNVWLANLTHHSFPSWFYYGDALGSFNSTMRLITGVLFGVGLVWFAFPYLRASFDVTARQVESKFESAGVDL